MLLSALAVSGTLLLVVTGLLNFSVFVRQLRSNREQLETTRRMLENARQQPEIQLVQRAMLATSEHLEILVEKPYLRPYLYASKNWTEEGRASCDEAMAELLLDNLASAIIHSAAFPQSPIRGVEQTIRFHLRNSPAMRDFLDEAFDRFPLAGLALLSLKNETKAQTEEDLRRLIAAAGDARKRCGVKDFSGISNRRTKRNRWNWRSIATTGRAPSRAGNRRLCFRGTECNAGERRLMFDYVTLTGSISARKSAHPCDIFAMRLILRPPGKRTFPIVSRRIGPKAFFVEPFLMLGAAFLWFTVLPFAGLFCSGAVLAKKL